MFSAGFGGTTSQNAAGKRASSQKIDSSQSRERLGLGCDLRDRSRCYELNFSVRDLGRQVRTAQG